MLSYQHRDGSRWPVLWLAALAITAGCVGSIDDEDGDLTAEQRAARADFDTQVMPLLDGNCAACHASQANVDFMKPDPDIYTRIVKWPALVNVNEPTQSRLLTRGAHTGPALTPEQSATVLEWIDLERIAAGGEDESVELDPFQPLTGLNTVDLGPIGMSGSTLTFRLEQLAVGIYLSEIMLNAGPDGAHVVHPLFVTWTDGAASPDPIDRFSTIDLSVGPGLSGMVGGGTAVFVDVPPTAMLSVHFREVEASGEGGAGGGGGGGGAGGCKALDAFTASAQPTLSANCASCHAGGNPMATQATDMTKINDTSPEGQAAACAQILSRVSLPDPPQSGIFIAPDPGSGTDHPFKFNGDAGAFGTFRDALTEWINQENAP
jgi:mono/diheme cytochrome c family protein